MANIPPHQVPVAPKSKVIAILLAFFLGTFGVHNFYLGYNTRGAIQAVVCVLSYLSMLIVIGFVTYGILWVWVIVELIMIAFGSGKYAVDAKGIPLD